MKGRYVKILQNDVPSDNQCPFCGAILKTHAGFNSVPYVVYAHKCPNCHAEFLRILHFE